MTSSRAYASRLIIAGLLLAAFGACAPTGSQVSSRQVLNEHTIQVGDKVPAVRTLCSGGERRLVGSPDSVQLITFSTPGDCSACETHVAGIEDMARRGLLPVSATLVFWAPQSAVGQQLREYSARVSTPVCQDEAGVFWNTPGISHTPVTALIRGGTVILLDDAPLVDATDQDAFLQAIKAATR